MSFVRAVAVTAYLTSASAQAAQSIPLYMEVPRTDGSEYSNNIFTASDSDRFPLDNPAQVATTLVNYPGTCNRALWMVKQICGDVLSTQYRDYYSTSLKISSLAFVIVPPIWLFGGFVTSYDVSFDNQEYQKRTRARLGETGVKEAMAKRDEFAGNLASANKKIQELNAKASELTAGLNTQIKRTVEEANKAASDRYSAIRTSHISRAQQHAPAVAVSDETGLVKKFAIEYVCKTEASTSPRQELAAMPYLLTEHRLDEFSVSADGFDPKLATRFFDEKAAKLDEYLRAAELSAVKAEEGLKQQFANKLQQISSVDLNSSVKTRYSTKCSPSRQLPILGNMLLSADDVEPVHTLGTDFAATTGRVLWSHAGANKDLSASLAGETLTFSNKSKSYIRIKSISVYLDGRIGTEYNLNIEVPPDATTRVSAADGVRRVNEVKIQKRVLDSRFTTGLAIRYELDGRENTLKTEGMTDSLFKLLDI